jgi:hypothetical protein
MFLAEEFYAPRQEQLLVAIEREFTSLSHPNQGLNLEGVDLGALLASLRRFFSSRPPACFGA